MRDHEIRRALRRDLTTAFAVDPSTLILDELGICCGAVRVDMAVVNGQLKGFEIKSDQDTLDRLPNQCSGYNRVFDTLTIVVSTRHLQRVETIGPAWWGVVVAEDEGHAYPNLKHIRYEGLNPDLDPLAVVQLLWRDEALSLLQANSMDKGLKGKPRRHLWRALADSCTLSELREMVRTQLKARPRWRVDSVQMPSDGKFPLFAKSSDFRYPHARSRNRRRTDHPN